MTPQLEMERENDALSPEASEHGIKRNPGAAIETTEITNIEGAKVAWQDVKMRVKARGLPSPRFARFISNIRRYMHAPHEGDGR